ncbi:hypothetical protein J2X02_000230 [Pseudoxanthomonas japonensis]|jgi:hypothetical protein|uniref:hypothetical protein n=1 Tax=Pseudoxanthomonas japonensis TaxID=69284 RepID=UPI001A5A0DA7|nr:hypothetical protein [Pseudoxanthomonas japonensis]MBL8255015.1 sel1 repeat family protein [Pseudoxanthomonas mexicana]MDR7067413.1 hypothetical protein [Pseudoxanthomonas japonensis]
MKTTQPLIGLLTLLLALQAPSDAWAQKSAGSKPPPDPTEDPVMLSAGFLSAHPDLRYRLLGLEERKQGKHEDAFRFFQRAGYYSDKPSQGMVAEMLWTGQGVAKDPALAYVWMDLAAERGYEGFLVLRERYWKALSESDRARAIAEGEALYAKFGDSAAQPRLATVLRRERRKMTGSRTGFTSNLQIFVPGPAGPEQIDGSKFFDERYWDPKQYQAWHDSIWKKPRVGRVSVGEVEQIQQQSPASRIPATTPQVDAQEPQTPERDESDLGTRKDG